MQLDSRRLTWGFVYVFLLVNDRALSFNPPSKTSGAGLEVFGTEGPVILDKRIIFSKVTLEAIYQTLMCSPRSQ